MVPMLLQLGAEGMSSDDDGDSDSNGSDRRAGSASTTGPPNPQRKIKRRIHDHPWRSVHITIALRSLDSVSGTQSSRGNRCNVRQYRGPIPSNREEGHAMVESLVLRLPNNYYNWTKLESWKGRMSEAQWTLQKWIDPSSDQTSTVRVPSFSSGTNAN